MKVSEVSSDKFDKVVNSISSKLGLRESERPTFEFSDLEATGGIPGTAEVIFEPKVGRFKVTIDPNLDWKEAQETLGHELGHIRDYRGNKDAYLVGEDKSDEWNKLRTHSRRELEARITEDNLQGKRITKYTLASWVRQEVLEFQGALNRKEVQKYLVTVAREKKVSPKVIRDGLGIVNRWFKENE